MTMQLYGQQNDPFPYDPFGYYTEPERQQPQQLLLQQQKSKTTTTRHQKQKIIDPYQINTGISAYDSMNLDERKKQVKRSKLRNRFYIVMVVFIILELVIIFYEGGWILLFYESAQQEIPNFFIYKIYIIAQIITDLLTLIVLYKLTKHKEKDYPKCWLSLSVILDICNLVLLGMFYIGLSGSKRAPRGFPIFIFPMIKILFMACTIWISKGPYIVLKEYIKQIETISLIESGNESNSYLNSSSNVSMV